MAEHDPGFYRLPANRRERVRITIPPAMAKAIPMDPNHTHSILTALNDCPRDALMDPPLQIFFTPPVVELKRGELFVANSPGFVPHANHKSDVVGSVIRRMLADGTATQEQYREFLESRRPIIDLETTEPMFVPQWLKQKQ